MRLESGSKTQLLQLMLVNSPISISQCPKIILGVDVIHMIIFECRNNPCLREQLLYKKKIKNINFRAMFSCKKYIDIPGKMALFYYILELLELSVSPQKHPNKVFHHTKAAYR